MRVTIAAVMAVLLCSAAGPPARAQQTIFMPVFCLSDAAADESLSSQGEQIAAMGISPGDAAVILWRHPDTHAFTILIAPSGSDHVCAIASGNNWERFERRDVDGDRS